MAEINFCDVLGWGPNHLQELRYSGYIYFREGQYATAKVFFDALTILDPENAYDWRMLGAIYLLLGDSAKAVEVLQTAIKLDPEHLGGQLNMTKGLLYLGRLAEGLEIAQKLTQCNDRAIADDAEALILAYK